MNVLFVFILIQLVLMGEIGLNLQTFMVASASNLEMKWNNTMKNFKINRVSFVNAGEKISLNQEDNSFLMLLRDIKEFGFVEMLGSVLEQLKSQIVQDQQYWQKYFKFNRDEDQA